MWGSRDCKELCKLAPGNPAGARSCWSCPKAVPNCFKSTSGTANLEQASTASVISATIMLDLLEFFHFSRLPIKLAIPVSSAWPVTNSSNPFRRARMLLVIMVVLLQGKTARTTIDNHNVIRLPKKAEQQYRNSSKTSATDWQEEEYQYHRNNNGVPVEGDLCVQARSDPSETLTLNFEGGLY